MPVAICVHVVAAVRTFQSQSEAGYFARQRFYLMVLHATLSVWSAAIPHTSQKAIALLQRAVMLGLPSGHPVSLMKLYSTADIHKG